MTRSRALFHQLPPTCSRIHGNSCNKGRSKHLNIYIQNELCHMENCNLQTKIKCHFLPFLWDTQAQDFDNGCTQFNTQQAALFLKIYNLMHLETQWNEWLMAKLLSFLGDINERKRQMMVKQMALKIHPFWWPKYKECMHFAKHSHMSIALNKMYVDAYMRQSKKADEIKQS